MTAPPAGIICVSAVVLRGSNGAILTVRKAGTDRFMLPGGKPEAGEGPAATAIRECAEEIGVHLDPAALVELGQFRAPAANEAGYQVEATIFTHPSVAKTEPAAEIAQLRWLDPAREPLPTDLAPLLAEHVIPALADRSHA